jgi:hypothetical protein
MQQLNYCNGVRQPSQIRHQQRPQLASVERLGARFVKTVFEEPQHLAADLGGIAKNRGDPVGAVGSVGLGGLTPIRFSQRLLVLDPVLAHFAQQ